MNIITKITTSKNTTMGIISLLLFSCFTMFIIDAYLPLEYFTKSFIKINLFLVLPIVYSIYNKSLEVKNYFKLKSKKQLLVAILLGLTVYLFIIGSYFISRTFIDLNNISASLGNDLNISGKNFIYVAVYISFVNSLLEEFFFRGFVFLSLKRFTSRKFAYLLSSVSFSLYHVAIILNWFNIFIFILILIGLAIAGLLFDWLNEKNGNIYNSWLVHMFANFAINSIGIFMFYF